jgi:rubrerythrin
MNLYICEICGEAYLGQQKPTDCPFCGARNNFLKSGEEAKPIVNEKIQISEISKKNLLETLALEIRANAIYSCVAQKTKENQIKAMYKRLAKVELEHAEVAVKILGIEMPEVSAETCAEEDVKNFERTIELEDHAVSLYRKFALEAEEVNVKKFFGALVQIESAHIELVRKYLPVKVEAVAS